MKNKIEALCENMLRDSSLKAKTFVKYESQQWGASDTLCFKWQARQEFYDAMNIAREFNLDIAKILTDTEFLRADELPRSQYED